MSSEIEEIRSQTIEAATELLQIAGAASGQLMIVGCSTSEVMGARIGSSGSSDVAQAILSGLMTVCAKFDVHLAVQCCEHLNRALVVQRRVAETYRLEPVMVMPVPKAGGALAAMAMSSFDCPVVVEHIQAHVGLDIGNTLIGMHLKAVAVPVRLQRKNIGKAFLTAALTRPKLIGGSRSVYK
ncbi:MAG: hypothetical protein H6Q69_4538 [Firmicutes bacterium]|nr:hypothetical protein [Bacillota bacterium]